VTGRHHLIGESVTFLADGSVMPSQTVTATGEITLSQGAARIHIGLAFTSDMRTLPIAVAQAEAAGQGRFKSATKVYLRVNKTRGIFAGPDASHLREYAQRTSEVYGAPTNMVSDEIEIRLDSAWSRGGQVSIRQSDPTPITILSMTWEGETGA